MTKSLIGKDLKKSVQLQEKLIIDCGQDTDTLNTSMKSQRSTREIKLFNLLNDDNDSPDDSHNQFNQIAQQQKEYQFFQLDNFLKSIQLSELFQLFIKNKVTDSLAINTLTEDQLIAMKITKDKRKKILNRITEINKPSNDNTTACGNDMGIQSNINDKDKEDCIVDFEENERRQAELFKKAVEEFRRGGKNYIPPPDNKEEEEEACNNNQKNRVDNPKKFLTQLGGRDLFNLNSISLFQDEGNDIKDDEEYLAELAIGRACWSCFKKIYDAYPITIDGKYFCGSECCDKYKKDNEVKCYFCNKVYYKNNGLYCKQNRFCSIDCFEKDKNKIIEYQNEEDGDDDKEDGDNNNKINALNLLNKNGNCLNEDFDILDI